MRVCTSDCRHGTCLNLTLQIRHRILQIVKNTVLSKINAKPLHQLGDILIANIFTIVGPIFGASLRPSFSRWHTCREYKRSLSRGFAH
jgi:hypothetical protein